MPGYDPHFFESLEEVESTHFWFVSRRETILRALQRAVPDLQKRRLFDIGCGTGGLLAHLGNEGIPLAGACDAYWEGLGRARDRLDAPLVLVDEGRLPPLGEGQDLIGMFDVLEHIDDDVGVLRELACSLVPGGVLALTVPAHSWLFSGMDEQARHRRRYSRATLRAALEQAGFEVVLLSHFMAPMVPALILGRWTERLFLRKRRGTRSWEVGLRVLPGLNRVMRWLMAAERAVMAVAPLPLGSSLVAVAARPR